MGESHFAFLGYSLAHEITPVRRELDYLRVIGTSKEHAKEVKLFGLGGHLHQRYASLTGGIIRKNISLTRHRLLWGSVFAVIWIHRLLRQLRVSGLAGFAGAHHGRHAHFTHGRDRRRQHTIARCVLTVLAHCRPGAAS